MGRAIVKLSLDLLREVLRLEDSVEIVGIFPPGFMDLQRHRCLMMVESPQIPPQSPGMEIPEVDLVFKGSLKDRDWEFVGFGFPNERKERGDEYSNLHEEPPPNEDPGAPKSAEDAMIRGKDHDPNDEDDEGGPETTGIFLQPK